MNDDFDVLTRLLDYHDHIAAPTVPVGDDVRRGRRRQARRRTMATGGVALAVAAVVVTASLVTGGQPDAAPEPAPQPSEKHSKKDTAIDPVPAVIPAGPSGVLGARQVGRYRMEVGGRVLPGRWELDSVRHDVWTAAYFDDVGYMSPALWWGRGTTTHEVPGTRGGVAISEDGHWIAWVRASEGGYDGVPAFPRVLEVVDTTSGEVRWSRDAATVAPEIAALAVTNDGNVVFGHCLEPTFDIGGTPQCDAARIDVWAPRTGRIETVPAAVSEGHGPPGTVTALDPLIQVDGMPHNGLLVREAEGDRPQYVRVDKDGEVEVVATLPRNTVAITADERFALLEDQCADSFVVCGFSALPLDGGQPGPVEAPSKLIHIATDYDLPAYPYVVEHGNLVVIRDLGDDRGSYPPVLRCSLAEARCIRIEG
ncbi:hypothetical protein F0U44_01165 [Nocardioides humilatus]|uniref:Uncharacterized protein n=1 Tax=Nocardioides humilatus TaxID=2607660 RepID=A0A5B1LMX2_9ACTN|nr:hypothetical protein [Nocardioides humilatus]KAA1420979.1 hypothetical protein F0U44_01165 [Nocardioides humilatus]